MKRISLWLLILSASLALIACRGGGGGSSREGGNVQHLGAAEGSSDTLVLVGFYATDQCEAGSEVYTITFDVSQTCFGWSREGGARGTIENSASDFQCYADRLCYTQYTEQLVCGAGHSEPKEASTVECIKEPNAEVWSRIISGTEACPAVPDGFACP
jgi:hypothetical protein